MALIERGHHIWGRQLMRTTKRGRIYTIVGRTSLMSILDSVNN
jgi:hypothetical protein